MTNHTKVFIVCGSSGEYSDANMWGVCAVYSEARAIEISDELNRLSEIATSLKRRLYEEFEAPYRASHKRNEESHTRPNKSSHYKQLEHKVKSGSVSPEDKDLFIRVQASYDGKVKAYESWVAGAQARSDEWHAAFEAARQAWLKENTPEAEKLAWAKTLDDDLGGHGYGTDYGFYELPIVDG